MSTDPTPTPPPLDLAALAVIAKAATPGPWKNFGYEIETVPEFDLHRFDVMSETVASCDLQKTDALHIAAFDPPTVLALIARAEAAEAAIARVEALANDGTFVAIDVYGDLSAAQCGDGEDLHAITMPDLRAALDDAA